MPPTFGPVPDCVLQTIQIDDPPRQRGLCEFGNLGCELVALRFKFFVPVRTLQAAQAIGQDDVRKESPHCTTDKRAIDSLSKVLLGWDAIGVRNDINIGGSVAHLEASELFLGCMPVARIVKLGDSLDSLARPHAIEKIMTHAFRPGIDGHGGAEFGADRSMVLPRLGAGRMTPAIRPIAEPCRY